MNNKRQLKLLYQQRFSKYERVRKNNLWQVLINNFLKNYIKPADVVVDIGAGSCEFINNIKAHHKIAYDANLTIKKFANSDVETICAPVDKLKTYLTNRKITVFFLSNVLEHMDSKEEAYNLLLDIFSILTKNGKLLIMQPDIKRIGNSYWDFFDHKIAITENSLLEVLQAVGFNIIFVKSPFMPYSTKLRWYPLSPFLLKIYLKIRLLQILFGKQFFVIAEKP